jgi:CelD/BcsL family acetyltransferase involved in cellulose biosynthesis
LAQWIDHFAPHAPFVALVVEQDGQWVAALPLVERRLGGLLPAATLAVNSWSSGGDLLLDAVGEQDHVLDCLVKGVRQLPWPLLWMDTMEVQEPRWTAFRTACQRAGLATSQHVQLEMGLIDISHDWDGYQRRWSKNLRQNIRRLLRKAEGQGTLRLEVLDDLSPDDVESQMVRGLEVEDRSWKGKAGTSVLRSPGMRQFFVDQARQLAAWNELQLSYLLLDDRPIAFEYGYRSAGVHFAHKTGYDDAYRDLSPGRLLTMLLLKRDHGDPSVVLTNCMGILTEADAKWCTRVRPVGRLVVGTGGPVGAACLLGYREVWPTVRKLRTLLGREAPPRLRPGCAPAAEPSQQRVEIV